MAIEVKKIPGGFSVDGLALRRGKCGCTSVLKCCYSWSKIKRDGDSFAFTVKATGPETKDNFSWGFTVRKDGATVIVHVEDARDKEIFSGFYPPSLEEWVGRGWEVVSSEGKREDFGLWRCAACKWLYKESVEDVAFTDLPEDWKCPVCGVGRESFEKIG